MIYKIFRHMITFVAMVLIITLSGWTGFAENEIQVSVDDQMLVFTDQAPMVLEGRTVLPARGILEALGLTLNWQADTRTITAVKDQLQIEMTLDSKTAYVNGQPVTLDVAATAINGRTLVPARFIAEATGAQVTWHSQTRLVAIKSLQTQDKDMYQGKRDFLTVDRSHFGKDMATLIAEEGNPDLTYDNELVYYGQKVSGFDIDMHYIFDQNLDVGYIYRIRKNYPVTMDQVREFEYLKSLFTEMYGQPSIDEALWSNADWQEDPEKMDQALVNEDLALVVRWVVDDVKIQMSLSSYQKDIGFFIVFRYDPEA